MPKMTRPKMAEPIPVKDFLRTLNSKDNYIHASDDLPNLIYCAGCRGNCDGCANSRVDEIQLESIEKRSAVPQSLGLEECSSASIILTPDASMFEAISTTGKDPVMIKRILQPSMN